MTLDGFHPIVTCWSLPVTQQLGCELFLCWQGIVF